MAVLKWQWNLWVRGENTSPFQDMKGLCCWMHLENVGENVSKEALPFFLCNKEVISLRNHLHIAFLFSVPQGQPPYWTASLLYSLERTTTAAQLHEPLLLRKNHFIVSPLWPPVFVAKGNLPSQGITVGGEGSWLRSAVLHCSTLHTLPHCLQRWQLCAN